MVRVSGILAYRCPVIGDRNVIVVVDGFSIHLAALVVFFTSRNTVKNIAGKTI